MSNMSSLKKLAVFLCVFFCASLFGATLQAIGNALDLPSNITVTSASSHWSVKTGEFSYGDCKNILSTNNNYLVGSAPGKGANARGVLTLTVTGAGTLYFNCVASLDDYNSSELSTEDRDPQSYEAGEDPYGFSAGGDCKECYEDSEDYTDFWCPYFSNQYESVEDWSTDAHYSISFDGSSYQSTVTFYLYPTISEDYEKPEDESYENKVYLDSFLWVPDEAVANIVFSPEYDPENIEEACFEDTLDVTITSSYEDAVIYYTTNGSAATTKSKKYTGPITLNASTVIHALAYTSTGLNVKGEAHYYKRTARPDIAPSVNIDKSQCTLTFSDQDANAVFYYTLDGTSPSSASRTGTSIVLNENATVNVIAKSPDNYESQMVTMKLDCIGKPANVTFTVDGQQNKYPLYYTNSVVATLNSPFEGGTTQYRINGGQWQPVDGSTLTITDSAQYDVLFTQVQDSQTLMALSSWETRKFDQSVIFSNSKKEGQIYLTSGWNIFPVKLYLSDTARNTIVEKLKPRKSDGSKAAASDLLPRTAFWTYLKSEQLTSEFFEALTFANGGSIPKEADKATLKYGWNLIPAPSTEAAWHWDYGHYSFSEPTTDEAIWFENR